MSDARPPRPHHKKFADIVEEGTACRVTQIWGYVATQGDKQPPEYPFAKGELSFTSTVMPSFAFLSLPRPVPFTGCVEET